jgi:DNA-binding XRE family transcriptional regulator
MPGLKEIRIKAGYGNRSEAAKALNISKSMLIKVETGERKPGRDLIYRMSIIYKCSMDDIFLSINDTKSVKAKETA